MSWLNFNESLNNIKGQISSFASGVLAEGIVNDSESFTEQSDANRKIQELQNLCINQEAEIKSLRRQNTEYLEKMSLTTKPKNENQVENNDGTWFWDIPVPDSNENSTNSTISDLTNRIQFLEDENKRLLQNLEQLDQENQRNTNHLISIKDSLQSDYKQLKSQYDCLVAENKKLAEENHEFKKQKDDSYTQTIDLTEIENIEDQYDTLKKEREDLKQNLTQVNSELNELKINYDQLSSKSIPTQSFDKLPNDFEELKKSYNDLSEIHKKDEEEILKLKNEIEKINKEKIVVPEEEIKNDKETHAKYLSVLSEMARKLVNFDLPDVIIQTYNQKTEFSEFTYKLEALLKHLVDFKWKTETLERKLCEITLEKTAAMTEKNHEIEKLLQNSEILSQEVITKTQTIKHYEIECSELIKNNELLIEELQQYKNNNGLQTISESNEDNLLLLETQLDNANKRIRDLELVINDLENAKQEVSVETQTELEYIKKQLNMTGEELSQSKKEYQELLETYKQMETEKNLMNDELRTVKWNYEIYKSKIEEIDSFIKKLNIQENILEAKPIHYENNHNLTITLEKYKIILQHLSDCCNSFKQELSSLQLQMQSDLQDIKDNTSLLDNVDENFNISQKMNFLINKIKELEQMTKSDQQLSDDVAILEDKINKLQIQNAEFIEQNQKLQSNVSTSQNLYENLNKIINELKINILSIMEENKLLDNKENLLEDDVVNLPIFLKDIISKINDNHLSEMNRLNSEKIQLIEQLKVKHEENLNYYSEIQRLNQVLSEEKEKCENLSILASKATAIDEIVNQNQFLKEKCDQLSSERQFLSEKEQTMSKELERLRMHLLEIQDTYAQEMLNAEKKIKEMTEKVCEIEQRERNSNTIYTSVSIRANQQVETLQNQLQLVINQRDTLQKKISDVEDMNNKHAAALTNLQCVLEQFQKDRDKDIAEETGRLRRQVVVEQKKQAELQQEIINLKNQLGDTKQGLKAASRLTEQIEKYKQQINKMKEEVTKLQSQLIQSEEIYNTLISQDSSKVDKTLIKNLIIGLINMNNNLNKHQYQIMKIIASVLDFSHEDSEKVHLNQAQSNSWLSAILHPALGNTNMSYQSLTEAFVKFLETESQPKPTPPAMLNMRRMSTESTSSTSSNTRQLNEIVLPTFEDFAQNRNSSSILKDILKEN